MWVPIVWTSSLVVQPLVAVKGTLESEHLGERADPQMLPLSCAAGYCAWEWRTNINSYAGPSAVWVPVTWDIQIQVRIAEQNETDVFQNGKETCLVRSQRSSRCYTSPSPPLCLSLALLFSKTRPGTAFTFLSHIFENTQVLTSRRIQWWVQLCLSLLFPGCCNMYKIVCARRVCVPLAGK